MQDKYIEIEDKIREIFDDTTHESLGSFKDLDYYDEDDFYDDTYDEVDYDSSLEEISEIVDTELENFLITRKFKNIFKLYYFLSHLMQEVLDTELSHAFYEELYDIRDVIAKNLQDFLMDGSENDKKEFFTWLFQNIDYLIDDTYDATYSEVKDYILDNINLETSVYSEDFINAYENFANSLENELEFVKNNPEIYSKYLKNLSKTSPDYVKKAKELKQKFLDQGIVELESLKI